ncbi:MAG: hypothetical protein Q8K67_01115 [Geothrix sp.]|nr:hypothetical protein [Geothrix sp.]
MRPALLLPILLLTLACSSKLERRRGTWELTGTDEAFRKAE